MSVRAEATTAISLTANREYRGLQYGAGQWVLCLFTQGDGHPAADRRGQDFDPGQASELTELLGDGVLDGAAINGVGDVVEQSGLGFLERRALQRQLDQVAELVARQMPPFWEGELAGGLPEDQRAGAITAATNTVGIGYSGTALVAASDFDPQRLEQSLRELDPEAARRALLDSAGTMLYDRVLSQTCVVLVELAAEDHAGEMAALTAILGREREILEIVDRLLERIPEPSSSDDPASRYNSLIVRHVDRLELFGLDVTAASRRYGLSVAYISLQAALGDEEDLTGGDPSARIEDLVAGHTRLGVRGEAGSGKTTLLSVAGRPGGAASA